MKKNREKSFLQKRKPFLAKRLLLLFLVVNVFSFQALANLQGEILELEMTGGSLVEVFAKVKAKTNYTFLYNVDDIKDVNDVTISASPKSVKTILTDCLKNTGLTYEIRDEVIIIKPVAKPTPARKETKAVQEEKKVSGAVTDNTGLGLPGVSVFIKGTSIGTTTNIDGKYNIQLPDGSKDILVYSFIGMDTQEIKVTNQKVINITLVADSEQLSEVVVTGMISTDKRLFTGASQKLEAEEIKLAGSPDISRALEGRAAGVSVQNVSGTFGTAPKIRVRGATSIYGSSKPLWVVDGIIMEDVVELTSDALSSGDVSTLISSAIAGLNSDDIESFEVLKDGSATSIYGARAMAGVIVITTKKGKAGVSRISYTGEFTSRLTPSYNDFNIMNSQEQMSVYEDMREGGWLNYADVANAAESGVYGRMYQRLNQTDAEGNFLLKNTPQAKGAFLRQAENRNTDWFDELFNTNLMQSHSISMSSGTKKATYYASVSALLDPGWTQSSKVNRYTANFKSNYKILDNLSFNTISNASYRKQKAPGTLSQDSDEVTGEVKRDFDINPYSFALNSSRTLDPDEYYTRNYAPFNIKKELDENYIDLNVVDVKFQTQLTWKVTPKVELSALGALKYQSTSQEHNITEFSNQAEAYRAMPNSTIRDKNSFLYTDPDNPYALPISILPQGGIYKNTNYSMLGYDFRATGSYKDVYKDVHILNLYGGMEINSTDRKKTNNTGWGMQYSMGEIPFYDYQLFKKGVENNNLYYGMENTRYRNMAFFGNATYSYNRRYTINGTLRYEGSNKLGKSNSARWLPTWNISGAWNAHEENFFEQLKPVLSNFTLKGSYSLTADRGPSDVTNSLVDIRSKTPWRPTAGMKESGLEIASLENSELTYEKKHEINIGAEIGFLNNRINTTVDWYTRDNFDLIGIVKTQGLGGEGTKYGNVASMESHGFEFSVSIKNIQTQNFSWVTNFVYSNAKNKITELNTVSNVMDLVSGNGFAREGYNVRSIFSIPFKGLNDEGLPTFLDQDGDVTVSDIYFQESEKLDFLEYSGSTDPTDIGSLSNAFTYKGLSLNVFMTYSFGNVVRLDPVFNSSYSDLTALPREFKNRWVKPGDEAYTNIPTLATVRQEQNIGASDLAAAYNAYNYSSARIAKGDFIRMKQISLAYSFPKVLTTKLGVSNLSLKLQATNLFLLYSDDKLNGQDPEFFNSGGVAAPVPKQFTFTLKLSL
ncbi:MAG: SusC/RagA family TonB-linked outer membrane protein [Labilibaculum antarcticum]